MLGISFTLICRQIYRHKLLINIPGLEQKKKVLLKVLPDAVCVKLQFWFVDHPQGIKLIRQSTFSHHELGGVGTIQAVHTISPQNSRLQRKHNYRRFCLL